VRLSVDADLSASKRNISTDVEGIQPTPVIPVAKPGACLGRRESSYFAVIPSASCAPLGVSTFGLRLKEELK